MIFVARYKDGTCGIAEASPFISRWYFEDVKSNELCEVARLGGMVSHDVVEELYEHEYPMISAAHHTAESEEPLFDPNADQTTPILKNPAQFKQMKKWGDNLVNRVRQAVGIEINRFGTKKK